MGLLGVWQARRRGRETVFKIKLGKRLGKVLRKFEGVMKNADVAGTTSASGGGAGWFGGWFGGVEFRRFVCGVSGGW